MTDTDTRTQHLEILNRLFTKSEYFSHHRAEYIDFDEFMEKVPDHCKCDFTNRLDYLEYYFMMEESALDCAKGWKWTLDPTGVVIYFSEC